MKRYRAKVLVAAAPRSGTMYTAQLLQALGLNVLHEQVGLDGAVSWCEQCGRPFSIELDGKQWPVEFEHVFHQVRDPLKAIPSICTAQPPAWRYASKYVPLPGHWSTLRAAMALWYYWNLRCEGQSEWRYRIEAIDEVFPELCVRLGLLETAPLERLRPALETVPRTVNSRSHDEVGWPDLFLEDPETARQVLDMSARYGYRYVAEDTTARRRRTHADA